MIYGPPLQKQAGTPLAGVPLVNGTPTVLTWNVPNDGQLHRVETFWTVSVTSGETGGHVELQFTLPDGTTGYAQTISGGGQGVGYDYSGFVAPVLVEPGSVVKVVQDTALTGGAATLWAELWGS